MKRGLVSFAAIVSLSGAGCAPAVSTPDPLAEAIERRVKELASDEPFSGAALVARNGEVLFEKAWGMASRAFGAPNRVDTKFNLGSMNKMFTAVAIAQLVEQKRLSFDDRVGELVFSGINGQLDIYWNSGYAVAVLFNDDPPAAERIAKAIREVVLKETGASPD